jgi:DNA (cytosine-5)-methyltransferase 1
VGTRPTFGSLFSGIGGLDLGLEWAGWECRWQVEIDPFCRAVLEKHWPHVWRWDDARTFPPHADQFGRHGVEERHVESSSASPTFGHDLDRFRVDLLCGGFPCQPVSVAGRGQGREDARWLWPEFSRLVGLLEPRWVLVENVPGLRYVNGGAAFAEVLSDLARLGYDAEWASVSAAEFGAPHLRYRVFVVASRRNEALGARGGGGTDVDGRPRVFRPEWRRERPRSAWWDREPDVDRMAPRTPQRVDRLRVLGNAVVPQVAEWVGRRILYAWTMTAK